MDARLANPTDTDDCRNRLPVKQDRASATHHAAPDDSEPTSISAELNAVMNPSRVPCLTVKRASSSRVLISALM